MLGSGHGTDPAFFSERLVEIIAKRTSPETLGFRG
jgi:hypothetical protein